MIFGSCSDVFNKRSMTGSGDELPACEQGVHIDCVWRVRKGETYFSSETGERTLQKLGKLLLVCDGRGL